MEKPKIAWRKLTATWITFLLLHFSYETFPNTLFKIIGEEGETTFFHMKMLFFAYLFTSIIEFLVRRKVITNLETFVYSRLLIAVAYPWLTITAWFSAEAVIGGMLPENIEIIYANVMTILGIYIALRIEELFLGQVLRPALKGSILIVFIAALLSYTAFSFQPPEHFFSTPPFEH